MKEVHDRLWERIPPSRAALPYVGHRLANVRNISISIPRDHATAAPHAAITSWHPTTSAHTTIYSPSEYRVRPGTACATRSGATLATPRQCRGVGPPARAPPSISNCHFRRLRMPRGSKTDRGWPGARALSKLAGAGSRGARGGERGSRSLPEAISHFNRLPNSIQWVGRCGRNLPYTPARARKIAALDSESQQSGALIGIAFPRSRDVPSRDRAMVDPEIA